MKKILSLVLAAAMLTTVAFAGDVSIGSGASKLVTPGNELAVTETYFKLDGKTAFATTLGYHFSSEYFNVTTKKFSKGSNFVKEVKFSEDANELLIVLNGEQYDLARPDDATKSPNLVIEKLEIKAKKDWEQTVAGKTVKVIDKGETYAYTGAKELFVGYTLVEKELDTDTGLENDKMVKFKDTKGDTPYETFDFDELDISLEGRAYKGDKIYVKVDGKANTDVLKMDDNADMRFYNVKTNGFPSTTTIVLAAEEDEFVYKIVDGKLSPSGLKWSDDDYGWTGKIRGAVSYVVSDVEMKNVASAAEGGTGTGNPDTGANDVVGIAAALAVVSLVAAGAVSMKK